MKTTDITAFELAKQYGPKIAVVEVHWQVGEHFQYNTGVLTRNHAASSYRQPVFVAGSNSHVVPERQLVPGRVYGPADLPAGYNMLWIAGHRLVAPNYDTETEIAQAAEGAGYNIDEAVELDV